MLHRTQLILPTRINIALGREWARTSPARLVSLAARVDKTTTLAALRQAAQRGRLAVVQGSDGVRRSSRKAVDAYQASKHQLRPGNTARSE